MASRRDDRRAGPASTLSSFDWHLPYEAPMSPRVRVQIRCAFPGPALDPTVVRFVADPSLGGTATEVDAEIARLRTTLDDFELRAAGDPIPLRFRSQTIRTIAVW